MDYKTNSTTVMVYFFFSTNFDVRLGESKNDLFLVTREVTVLCISRRVVKLIESLVNSRYVFKP